MTDPYDIYNSYFDAIGGIDDFMAESTSYIEADITYAGLQGTLRMWKKLPSCERCELDLQSIKQTDGDNGQVRWSVDTNGKLSLQQDENTLKRREIKKLDDQLDFLDRNSSTFTLTLKGIEKFSNRDCYVLEKANTINDDICELYFDTSSLLIVKEIKHDNVDITHSEFSDYRKVGSILRPFRIDVLEQPVGNEITTQITKYKVNPDIDETLFNPPKQVTRDYEFLDGNSAENIPFEYSFDHIFVFAEIAGKRSKWLLDTGASATVIDSTFAANLGIKSEGDLTGRGATGTANFSFGKLPILKLAGVELKEQTVAISNLQSIFRKTGWNAVVGVLGYDFISRFVLKVDYANKVMAIIDPAAFNYGGKGKVLDMQLRNNKPVVKASVDEEFSGMWQVDIGAGNCDFMYPFAERSGFLKKHGIERTGAGAGGMCTEKDVQFKSFELGGFVIERPIISFPTANVTGGFRDTETVGNLGNDILRHFIVWFDYNNQRMILEKGSDFSKRFSYDKSGISAFFNDDDLLEINSVSSDTPGAEAGIKVEDIILAINKTEISYPDGRRIFKELMAAEEGIKYKISIKRGQQVFDIDLVLRELYDQSLS